MNNKEGEAAVLYEPDGDFVIKEYSLPDPAPGTLLLKVELCGICGADPQIYQGKHHETTFPLIMGHEICGQVIARGQRADTDFLGRSVVEGDRIVFVPAVHCGKCYFCSVVKTRSKCVRSVQYGFFSNPDHEPHFSGGYAQYLYLHHPGTEFFKVDVAPEKAVLTEPLAVAIHGVTRAQLSPGDSVVVQGSGPIGLLTLLYCKVAGAGKVIVVDKGRKERLRVAKEFGADVTIDVEEIPDIEDRCRIVKDATVSGYGADAVFECAGVPEVVVEGIKYLRDSGTYCMVGNAVDKGTIPLNPCLDILDKNITIEGIFDHAVDDFIKAVNVIENIEIPLSPMISHKVSLRRLRETMQALIKRKPLDGREVLKVVVDPWQ